MQFGLVGDPFSQYVAWLGRAISRDLGESYRLRQDVVGLIADRLPITLELVAMATIIAIAVAIPLGIAQARRRELAVRLRRLASSRSSGCQLPGVLHRDRWAS